MDVDRVLVLISTYETAVEAGKNLTPEEHCRDCPELLPDFLRRLANFEAGAAALTGQSPGDIGEPNALPDAGRYKPIRLHERGGQGVVYEAEDGEVSRTVAVKFVKSWLSDDKTIQDRFLFEAEVTSRLEHPGVVPVFGLGRNSEGQPYYAMRFINHPTFRAKIHEFHKRPANDPGRDSEFRGLLREFITVSKTVAYAHKHGFIHRDIKPANIFCGDYGETLLGDWGLAKRLGKPDPDVSKEPATEAPESAGANTATQDGAVLGTLNYMPQEQARGDTDQVGRKSDVFLLRATLYEILTARPPYDGTLEQALAGQFTAPRQVKTKVKAPRPLDSICLKAMAKLPKDRYESASELALDVERWLEDKPVSAWREPFLWRARRWTKRHRLLLTGAIVASLVGVAGLAALAALEHRKNTELKRAYGELETSNRRVEKNYALARQGVFQIVAHALSARELHRPSTSFEPTKYLDAVEQVVPWLEEAEKALLLLLEGHGDDREGWRALAGIQLVLTIHLVDLRRLDEARNALTRARHNYERLLQQDLGDTLIRLNLAETYLQEGRIHFDLAGGRDNLKRIEAGKPPIALAAEEVNRAKDSFERAQEFVEKLIAEDSGEQEVLKTRAELWNWLGATALRVAYEWRS
jgi:serine/threonine-protein kinase